MKFLTTAVLLFFSLASSLAQSPQLTSSDIDKMIETLVPITAEFEKLSGSNSQEVDPTAVQTLGKTEQEAAILSKYNWDETYFTKLTITFKTLTFLTKEKEFSAMPNQEQAMMKQRHEQLKKELIGNIAEADIYLIKERYEELRSLFQKLE